MIKLTSKTRFSTEARLPNLRPPLDSCIRMSSGVISIPYSEYWLALHTKWGKVKLAVFIVSIEKCDFLQTVSNIDILYIVGKNFSPRVWIRDRYLKIRLYLARINWQSLSFLRGKVCRLSKHFRREWRVPLCQGGWEEPVGIQKRRWKWPEDGRATPSHHSSSMRRPRDQQWCPCAALSSPLASSSPFELREPMHVRRWCSGGLYLVLAVWIKEREKSR